MVAVKKGNGADSNPLDATLRVELIDELKGLRRERSLTSLETDLQGGDIAPIRIVAAVDRWFDQASLAPDRDNPLHNRLSQLRRNAELLANDQLRISYGEYDGRTAQIPQITLRELEERAATGDIDPLQAIKGINEFLDAHRFGLSGELVVRLAKLDLLAVEVLQKSGPINLRPKGMQTERLVLHLPALLESSHLSLDPANLPSDVKQVVEECLARDRKELCEAARMLREELDRDVRPGKALLMISKRMDHLMLTAVQSFSAMNQADPMEYPGRLLPVLANHREVEPTSLGFRIRQRVHDAFFGPGSYERNSVHELAGKTYEQCGFFARPGIEDQEVQSEAEKMEALYHKRGRFMAPLPAEERRERRETLVAYYDKLRSKGFPIVDPEAPPKLENGRYIVDGSTGAIMTRVGKDIVLLYNDESGKTCALRLNLIQRELAKRGIFYKGGSRDTTPYQSSTWDQAAYPHSAVEFTARHLIPAIRDADPDSPFSKN